jgi:hypothetical protein
VQQAGPSGDDSNTHIDRNISPALPIETAPIPKGEDVTCGIEDDIDSPNQPDDCGLSATAERLIHQGRFGGADIMIGQAQQIPQTMDPGRKYSLVVLGELFRDKDHAVQMRMTREMAKFLMEKISCPVITGEELQERSLVRRRQIAKAAVFLILTALIYFAVFTHQEEVLSFISRPEGPVWHVVATAGVALFIPVIAYLYGSATGFILRLLKI